MEALAGGALRWGEEWASAAGRQGRRSGGRAMEEWGMVAGGKGSGGRGVEALQGGTLRCGRKEQGKRGSRGEEEAAG